MAFDEDLAERVREVLPDDVMARMTERKMFGGLAFMLDGNMVVGIMSDELMARLGPDAVVVTVFADRNKKYLSTDLMRDEPVRPEYLSPEVELTGFTAYQRLCTMCAVQTEP